MKKRYAIQGVLHCVGLVLILVIMMTNIGGCGGGGGGGGSWVVDPPPVPDPYSTSDLEGTWYMRSIRTQHNGQVDNFGYDIGTFIFQSDGSYSGNLEDQDGTSWTENGNASVAADGVVTLWTGADAVMSANRNIILADYSDSDEYDLDVFARQSSLAYSTSDLEGTWRMRSIRTHHNGQLDNFGYDTGTFVFQSDGTYSGNLEDQDGSSWTENGNASVAADGAVTLWTGADAVMSADKNVIISDYADGDEYDLDILVRQAL